jgi:hypothetical protein
MCWKLDPRNDGSFTRWFNEFHLPHRGGKHAEQVQGPQINPEHCTFCYVVARFRQLKAENAALRKELRELKARQLKSMILF